MRFVAFAVVTLLMAFGVFAAEKEKTPAIVQQLLAKVAASDCKFVRNGSDHSGKDAAKHMRRKYDHFKDEIATPEQFIEKCASKSELSGKPYMIKLPDGKRVPAREWMLARLAEVRGGTPPDSKAAR